MSEDLIKRSDAIKIVRERLDSPYMQNRWQQGACLSILRAIESIPPVEIDTTELAKAVVHKMIDNTTFAEDAYPGIKQKLHDVVEDEPKRGEWIDMWDKYDFEGTFKCSVCGTPWTLLDGTPQDNGMNFCPNCGADMRGKDDE